MKAHLDSLRRPLSSPYREGQVQRLELIAFAAGSVICFIAGFLLGLLAGVQ